MCLKMLTKKLKVVKHITHEALRRGSLKKKMVSAAEVQNNVSAQCFDERVLPQSY